MQICEQTKIWTQEWNRFADDELTSRNIFDIYRMNKIKSI